MPRTVEPAHTRNVLPRNPYKLSDDVCMMEVGGKEANMTIAVVQLTKAQLIERRNSLLGELRISETELRDRVEHEMATFDERAIFQTLDEIAFLLAEDET
jgi:hypothetical protein